MNYTSSRQPLLGYSLAELEEAGMLTGCREGSGRRLAYWLYRKAVLSFDPMVSIRKSDRQLLAASYSTGVVSPVSYVRAADGTCKYLFRFEHNRYVETALMPGPKRTTLCVSSQAGCRMGCSFCNTAANGYCGQLSVQEIVTQLAGIPEAMKVNHIVVMGMGEPFDNTDAVIKALEIFSAEWGFAIAHRNITVSSAGLMPGLIRFTEQTNYNLAISLHSPFEEERALLMPAQKVFSIIDVVGYLKQNPFKKPRRLTFEYMVLQGVNHTEAHAVALFQLLKDLQCHVNLIGFNPFPGSPFQRPSGEEVMQFRNRLDQLGLMTTIRESRGADIEAACGMLAGKNCEL
ncbi:MAG TPA: 23S rRNA (adenine(2503)-C(2))-methyltransferase RlmN [Bacteroidales bacterium]|nr:23S rRNA (adenine(2503)-C(2))-methyltransferase RlmN [Bacteroidales bacterium]HBZ65438.1 23S rRNA (adenine(2503)-C(2))-methyltransferase RlmN [Bacteroidales bacterium]